MVGDDRGDGELAAALGDIHRRRALGETIDPEAYRERLGAAHAEFREILRAEQEIDRSDASPPGETLPRPFGAYTLLRVLGRGGVGVVYEAVHRDLGRSVALKVLRSGVDPERADVERFRREARACSQVRHDHIVQIYEAGEADGLPWYAMELLPGSSLDAVIAAGRVPPPKELFAAMAGVADALHALHRAGIVHRDVKPSNVMVRPDGRMVLADFGLARTASAVSLTRTGEALGTPLYMSPEQILAHRDEIDARTDVYGLGATLYEALTGRPVFPLGDVGALLRTILFERPVPPRSVVPSVPPEAERVVLKALEKRREDRYPTAAEMRDDVIAFATGRPVTGRPLSLATRVVRRLRRHALAISIVLGAVVAGWLAWNARPGTLALATVPPGAVVLVDGVERGTTPVELGLSPGTHRLTFRRGGFVEAQRVVELGAGGSAPVEVALRIADPGDERALSDLGAAIGIPVSLASASGGVIRAGVARGVADRPAVEAVFPRGDVRVEDLDVAVLDVHPERAAPSGHLEFRAGNRRLARIPVRFEDVWSEHEIPAEVRAALRPGDRVTWGFWPDPVPGANGVAPRPSTATFDVVARAGDADVAEVERRMGEQPRSVAQALRARWLLAKGLPTAALSRSLASVREDAGDTRAWRVVVQALESMGLSGSALSEEARAAAEGAAPGSLARLLRRTRGEGSPGKPR